MNLSRPSLIAAAALLALPAPSLACQLDGTPGFDGFHRLNPFEDAYRRYQGEDRFPVPEQRGEEPLKERKLEASAKTAERDQPVRDARKAQQPIR